MSVKTPNYVLKEDYVTYIKGDRVEYKAGTFVKPVEPCYLPKHILDDDKHRWFNKDTEAYVYTHYGFITVPKNLIREV